MWRWGGVACSCVVVGVSVYDGVDDSGFGSCVVLCIPGVVISVVAVYDVVVVLWYLCCCCYMLRF